MPRNSQILIALALLLLLAASAFTAPPYAPGTRERDAIRELQLVLGLPLPDRDGIVGPTTLRAARALAARVAAIPHITPTPAPVAGTIEGPPPAPVP